MIKTQKFGAVAPHPPNCEQELTPLGRGYSLTVYAVSELEGEALWR